MLKDKGGDDIEVQDIDDPSASKKANIRQRRRAQGRQKVQFVDKSGAGGQQPPMLHSRAPNSSDLEAGVTRS